LMQDKQHNMVIIIVDGSGNKLGTDSNPIQCQEG